MTNAKTFWLALPPWLTERDTSDVFSKLKKIKKCNKNLQTGSHRMHLCISESPMFRLGLRQKILELSSLESTNFKQKTSETHPREFEKSATFLCQLILPPVHSYGKTWYDVWYDLPFSGTVYELILTDKSWNTASPQIFCLHVLDLDPVSQRPLKDIKRKLPRNGSVWITAKIIVFLERPFIE